jgi:hypothetical protein
MLLALNPDRRFIRLAGDGVSRLQPFEQRQRWRAPESGPFHETATSAASQWKMRSPIDFETDTRDALSVAANGGHGRRSTFAWFGTVKGALTLIGTILAIVAAPSPSGRTSRNDAVLRRLPALLRSQIGQRISSRS